jgi:hypothetical protein
MYSGQVGGVKGARTVSVLRAAPSPPNSVATQQASVLQRQRKRRWVHEGVRELQLPGRLASGSSMKNFQPQSRHRFRPPPMRLHLPLWHFGHSTLGTRAR